MTSNTKSVPTYKALSDDKGFTSIKTPSGAIMYNLPGAQEYKWDPNKNFPSTAFDLFLQIEFISF